MFPFLGSLTILVEYLKISCFLRWAKATAQISYQAIRLGFAPKH